MAYPDVVLVSRKRKRLREVFSRLSWTLLEEMEGSDTERVEFTAMSKSIVGKDFWCDGLFGVAFVEEATVWKVIVGMTSRV